MMTFLKKKTTLVILVLLIIGCFAKIAAQQKPNILFCIADDQSFKHTSYQGTAELYTPNIDRVAKNGVVFNNAYTNVSSCAPSRAAILTGRNIWELEEAGLLFGGLPKKYTTFSTLLSQNGYSTGHSGKGYMPANKKEPYQTLPLAPEFNDIKMDAPKNMSNKDYAENFKAFLSEKDDDKPFFFWYGSHEAHRAYHPGSGARAGKDISKIEVPGFLPNNDLVRNDIADYYNEIEWFDSHLGRMIKALEKAGELDNTIIIVTADNGMPFPRAKSTCYDYGTHMPLAICWSNKIKGGNRIDDFISFTDFAPTLLEAAGIAIPADITGNSFLDVLLSNKSGQVNPKRDRVFTALERHTYCRPGGMPYPIRTIRKGDWLYIVNFEPDRWPAGNPDFDSPHQGFYGDIDASPSREYLIANKDQASVKYYAGLSLEKRPKIELYNVREDPYQLHNLAKDEAYTNLCIELKANLFTYLKKTNDPRIHGKSPWDNYPYYFYGYETEYLKPFEERQ